MKRWRIIQAGLQSTFQDAGRIGQAHKGIPVSGALDLPAAQWANRLLGNDHDAAVIEITLTGLRFETECDCSIALTGAVFLCTVNDQAIDHNQTINLKAGDVFAMNKRQTGARSYLAVAGGFEVPAILNSFSTLVSANVGGFSGRVLAAGDELTLQQPHNMPNRPIAPWKRPKAQNIHVIRALPGPEYDLFDAFSQQSVWQQAFEVTPDCNRMGMRLHNQHELHALKTISSSGVVPGSLQVTPDGDSIMTLNDGQVTGGYPRILVTENNQLPILAQVLPGDSLYFYRQSLV